MEKGNISDYRSKLDKTLASRELTDHEKICTLVKNQLLQSSNGKLAEYKHVVERRSKEVSSFLSMLRSACVNDNKEPKSKNESHNGWKLKQDTNEYRVMYQEGPVGTPFHTLLVEGYVDGPVDACLCISSEADLYQKWWPQTAIPTFKLDASHRLKKLGIGEQIALMRMKVSWPLSIREAIIHYSAFEYLEDGLVLVLLNSISNLEQIDRNTHGFTRDGIPDADDVIRMDLVGGFAIQKVNAERSYFRTITNMDIKLDFVPPSFINFISRQLIGSGFKLYKKEVALVSEGDGKFSEALKDPFYTRIHEALYSHSAAARKPSSTSFKEKDVEPDEIVSREVEQAPATTYVVHENIGSSEAKNKVVISSDIQEALATLDKAISIFRDYNRRRIIGVEEDAKEKATFSQTDKVSMMNDICDEPSTTGSTTMASDQLRNSSQHGFRSHFSDKTPHKGFNYYMRDSKQSKIVPAAPDECNFSSCQMKGIDSRSSLNKRTAPTIIPNTKGRYLQKVDAKNVRGEHIANKWKSELLNFFCLSSASR